MPHFAAFRFLRPVKALLSTLCILPLSLWAQFSFGVASGDPQPESVVLWTALEAVTQEETVVWELSTEPDFSRILTSGSFTTSPERGGTVKVIAGGLEAGQTYYYRFWWNQHVSPLGRTRTAPHPPLHPSGSPRRRLMCALRGRLFLCLRGPCCRRKPRCRGTSRGLHL